MKKKFTIFILLAVVGVAAWLVYAGFKWASKGRTTTEVAVAVEVTPVKKSAISEVLTLTGSLTPRQEYIAAARISGQVMQLLVDLGDEVERDQLIAVIDDEEYALQVKEAEAMLQVAQASLKQNRGTLEVARREFERAQALKEKNFISESDFDLYQNTLESAEAGFKVAQAQVNQYNAALKSARVSLSHTRVLASWEQDGGPRTIGGRFVDEGALVKANDPIVSILDINSLVAEVYVVESDYFRIKTGQEARITTDAFPGRTFIGRITRIAPLLEEATREAKVEIEVPNNDRELRPGMYIRAEVVLDSRDNATLAPVIALVRRDGEQGLFVLNPDGESVSFISVKVGIVNGEDAEILEPGGLAGMVVTMGQHLLHDGARVILPEGQAIEEPDARVTGQAGPKGRKTGKD